MRRTPSGKAKKGTPCYLTPPALRDGGIFLTPIAGLEGLQHLQARLGIPSAVDGSQRRHDGFFILVRYKLQGVPDQMNNTGLDDRLGKDGCYGLGKALQPINYGYQDDLAVTAFQLVHHPKPELCPFGLLDLEPES